MKRDELKKLATLIVEKRKIDSKLAKNIVNTLSRQELLTLTRIIERMLNKKTVKVLSGKPLSASLKKSVSEKYKKYEVVFEIDEKEGDGIKVMHNDTIFDLTVRGFVDRTIDTLKQ